MTFSQPHIRVLHHKASLVTCFQYVQTHSEMINATTSLLRDHDMHNNKVKVRDKQRVI